MIFGLSESEIQVLQKLIVAPLVNRGARVWIFGSRARGDHKPFSDVDLMFENSENAPVSDALLFSMKQDLEESNFPYKLDLVDAEKLASSYRSKAFSERKPLIL